MKPNLYCTGHISSQTVTKAMGEGFGMVAEPPKWGMPIEGPAAFYGRDRGTMDIVRQCEADRVPWFMADNGYITPRIKGDAEAPGRFAGYYKISKNGWQHSGHGEPDFDRLEHVLELTGQTFRPTWKPRRDDELGHVLVCPPIADYERVHAFHAHHWLRHIKIELRRMRRTVPRVRLRYKPDDPRVSKVRSLEEDFKKAVAVITHDSNIAVEAILAGVPIFVTGTSPAQAFGNVDIHNVMNPNQTLDRWTWLAILAANQWTLDEIAQGMANETLGITP